jgi:hypothetical protein
MADFTRSISGALTQHINPWQFFFQPVINFGSISLGRSAAPEVEAEVIDRVGSYGRQLGRMGDALAVLIRHFKPDTPLTEEEQKAIRSLTRMLEDIAEIKEGEKARLTR